MNSARKKAIHYECFYKYTFSNTTMHIQAPHTLIDYRLRLFHCLIKDNKDIPTHIYHFSVE